MKGDGAAATTLAREELGFTPEEIATLTPEEASVSPRVKQTAGLMRFWWAAEQVQIAVSRIHQHKDGRLTAEIKVMTTAPGYPTNLHQTQINFVATRSKAELAKHLTDRRNDVDWTALIEQLAWEVIERVRQGEPVIEISTEDEVEPLIFLVDPILPMDEATVIYGLGGCGKSTMALVLGICVQLAWTDNPLGFKIINRKGVMYLDWETNYRVITRRMKALRSGMSIANFIALHYRRCSIPLADDTEAIQRAILDNNIGFVVVDSVAAACGGDLNAAEPALRMFAALRELKVTSLLVAHTSKNPATKETTVYGSGFFNFYARSVWEMKKVQTPGSKGLKVGLYHKKANDSELFRPLGFDIKWDRVKSTCIVGPIDVGSVSELATEGSTKEQIEKVLVKGQMTARDIAQAIGRDEVSTRARLNDLKKIGRVFDYGDERHRTWGLAARHEDD